MSVNKAILIGNLGRDPEFKELSSGMLCKFSVATTERWTNESGDHEQTEWHNIVTWGKLADVCSKWLHKGSKVYIEGSIQTKSWEATDGKKQYMTQIKAQKVEFLDPKEPRQVVPSADNGYATENDVTLAPKLFLYPNNGW